ncbi:hypothetical protein D3C76_1842360 [compost metagenome]
MLWKSLAVTVGEGTVIQLRAVKTALADVRIERPAREDHRMSIDSGVPDIADEMS